MWNHVNCSLVHQRLKTLLKNAFMGLFLSLAGREMLSSKRQTSVQRSRGWCHYGLRRNDHKTGRSGAT